ncbi:hypothetical protein KIW84_070417 [Lathyrus oleraceus]|uniref:Uncharacterized protein n=1 Tax=Pisum sativum TaxID=3888 RepID=A0A9D4ZS70_PEA|nr:hypothetical protein KIW84_070417 [Pisum sativum]
MNPKSVGTDVDHFEVINDVVPLSIFPVHATPIRKPKTAASKKGKPSKVSTISSPSMAVSDVRNLDLSNDVRKPHSMSSLYLDPINVKVNVDASAKRFVVPEVMGNVETSENTNKPRSVMTLSKSSMTDVVSDVSTSLAQTDNPIETTLDKSNENVSTQSPEKLEEKDDSDGMFGDLLDKEENYGEKKG